MEQVFIFGDSLAYGVGAKQAGWADLLKQALRAKMYSTEDMDGTYEVYNFGYPGIKSSDSDKGCSTLSSGFTKLLSCNLYATII